MWSIGIRGTKEGRGVAGDVCAGKNTNRLPQTTDDPFVAVVFYGHTSSLARVDTKGRFQIGKGLFRARRGNTHRTQDSTQTGSDSHFPCKHIILFSSSTRE